MDRVIVTCRYCIQHLQVISQTRICGIQGNQGGRETGVSLLLCKAKHKIIQSSPRYIGNVPVFWWWWSLNLPWGPPMTGNRNETGRVELPETPPWSWNSDITTLMCNQNKGQSNAKIIRPRMQCSLRLYNCTAYCAQIFISGRLWIYPWSPCQKMHTFPQYKY